VPKPKEKIIIETSDEKLLDIVDNPETHTFRDYLKNHLAIIAFVLVFFTWPIGLILGVMSLRKTSNTDRFGKVLSIITITLGVMFGIIMVFLLRAGRI